MQADNDGSTAVAGDDAAVLLLDRIQVLDPGLDAVAGRDAERDEVEPGECGGALGVVPERDRSGAVGCAESDAAQQALDIAAVGDDEPVPLLDRPWFQEMVAERDPVRVIELWTMASLLVQSLLETPTS